MSVQNRKARERAIRRELIISAARVLAETEGWEAVTIRRLAERIEYSQPVLYSHFRGRDDIVSAVALEGFTELGEALRSSQASQASGRGAVMRLAETYLAYAEQHPAVYEAMFSLGSNLVFAAETTPLQLREAFAALLGTLGKLSAPAQAEVFTEVVWAALHGLVTLSRAGRLPPEGAEERLAVLVKMVAPA